MHFEIQLQNKTQLLDIRRLVRHPAAYPTESLYGYMLRLSQENGYSSCSGLFSLMGMPSAMIGTAEIAVARLAVLTNQSVQNLETISYKYVRLKSPTCRLLGNQISVGYLRLRTPSFCTECVVQKGFIEAHFDLACMTGCPEHRRVVLSACSDCGAPLRWARPGLTECQCGASLLNAKGAPLSRHKFDLLDMVRRKVLGLPPGERQATDLSAQSLRRMRLRDLIRLIDNLGKNHHRSEDHGLFGKCQATFNRAAAVLAKRPPIRLPITPQRIAAISSFTNARIISRLTEPAGYKASWKRKKRHPQLQQQV
jgi:TniQ